jgi:hypothetical protein
MWVRVWGSRLKAILPVLTCEKINNSRRAFHPGLWREKVALLVAPRQPHGHSPGTVEAADVLGLATVAA